MNKIIYAIQKTEFDNMMNHYPKYYEFIGYSDTEEGALRHVERLDSGKKYEGWNYKYYPKYTIIPIKKIDLEVQKSDNKQ